MPMIRVMTAPALLTKAQIALGLSQEELGRRLGSSRRTVTRWVRRHSAPSIEQWVALVRQVHPVNPALAAEIAAEMGETLESFGLASAAPAAAPLAATPDAMATTPQPAPRAAPPIAVLADSIVCAAAEAVAATPQGIRPALVAAFDRAALAGLTLDEVRAALRADSASTPRTSERG